MEITIMRSDSLYDKTLDIIRKLSHKWMRERRSPVKYNAIHSRFTRSHDANTNIIVYPVSNNMAEDGTEL